MNIEHRWPMPQSNFWLRKKTIFMKGKLANWQKKEQMMKSELKMFKFLVNGLSKWNALQSISMDFICFARYNFGSKLK